MGITSKRKLKGDKGGSGGARADRRETKDSTNSKKNNGTKQRFEGRGVPVSVWEQEQHVSLSYHFS